MVYYIGWLVDIEKYLHPWNECHLIMLHDLLVYCWIQIDSILSMSFASTCLRVVGLQFPLNVFVLVSGNASLTEQIRKCSLYFYFPWESVENWHLAFLKCLVEFTSDVIWVFSDYFLFPIPLIDIGLFSWPSYPCVSFGSSFLLSNGPISLCFQICGHCVVYTILLWFI